MMGKKSGKLSIITSLVLYVYLLSAFMPVMAYLVPSVVKTVFALYLWFAFRLKFSSKWLPLLIIPVFSLIQKVFDSPVAFLTQLYFIINLATVAAVFWALTRGKYHALSRRLFFFIVGVYTVNAITTIVGNILFPDASRHLASVKYVGDMYGTYMKYNIGGFDVVYALSLSIALLAIMFKCNKNTIIRLVVLSLAVVFLFAVIQSQYTMALVGSLALALLFFIPMNVNKKRLFPVIGITALVLFVIGGTTDIFDAITAISGSESVGQRMDDLSTVISGDDLQEVSDVVGRFEKYMMSINAFLHSPLVGTMFSGDEVGGHSFILDSVASYGVFGIIALVLMYRTFFKYYVSCFRDTSFGMFVKVLGVAYVLLTLFNPQPLIIFISFAMPLCLLFTSQQSIHPDTVETSR